MPKPAHLNLTFVVVTATTYGLQGTSGYHCEHEQAGR